MQLDWDVLYKNSSIKGIVSGFEIRQSEGAYTRELTISIADKNFYDQLDFTSFPQLSLEVKTQKNGVWKSQGKFYIEQPANQVNINAINCNGIWGRSETARAGAPFAPRISKAWDFDTTFKAIATEMAFFCSLSLIFQIDDYPVYANSYSVDQAYPINVIAELAKFAGAYVSCTAEGELVIKPYIFQPATAKYTVTDPDIISLNESIQYPSVYGNRVRLSAAGNNAGYQIDLRALKNAACLPADGATSGVIVAVISDQNGKAVPDNTIVNFKIDKNATLAKDIVNTQEYALLNQIHKATDYNHVEVDFNIADVISIYAYADTSGKKNFYDSAVDSFDKNVITLTNSQFDFCDQTLRINYKVAGVAANTITAGTETIDTEVTAAAGGSTQKLKVHIGNICACGSSLNVKANPSGSICFGNYANILIWAVINNLPATGYPVVVKQEGSCGTLSAQNKTLKKVNIVNESGTVINNIKGVSQTECTIIPANPANISVFLKSDKDKNNNLYDSHKQNLINLNTIFDTGTEVVIDYTAAGAALVKWTAPGSKCDEKIVVSMADGTEAGLRETISIDSTDCSSSNDPGDIPDYDDDTTDGDSDPTDDQDSDDGGWQDDDDDTGGGQGGDAILSDCDVAIINRETNIGNAVTEDQKNDARFGSSADCPENGQDWDCSCDDLCMSEIQGHGKTYDESQTIHEKVTQAGYVKGTPDYNEAFEKEKQNQLDTCSQKCQETRDANCAQCEISGPDVLDPGESAEYVDGNGTIVLHTMQPGECVSTVIIGCGKKEIRSSAGHWEKIVDSSWQTGAMCVCVGYGGTGSCDYDHISGGSREQGSVLCCISSDDSTCVPANGTVQCDPGCDAISNDIYQYHAVLSGYSVYEWQCDPN